LNLLEQKTTEGDRATADQSQLGRMKQQLHSDRNAASQGYSMALKRSLHQRKNARLGALVAERKVKLVCHGSTLSKRLEISNTK
jgi:hypothetical protein